MCGVVGVLSQAAVNQELYDACTMLQHRGQDAAGIITCDGDRLWQRRSNGLVREAIRPVHMARLLGNYGLGHVRYPTAGSMAPFESQPFYVNSPYGLALVHNGNLVNAAELSKELSQEDLRHLNTNSDSEVLLNIFAHELGKVAQPKFDHQALFKAVERVNQRVIGAYSAIVLIQGQGMLAFRDPHGIRPLVYGEREGEHGTDYMFASETIPLDSQGYKCMGDVKPGEAIFIDLEGRLYRHICAKHVANNPCLFEFIYLARPDSVIDNISVYRARNHMGTKLGERILHDYADLAIDVVIPIPDTSRNTALYVAKVLNKPFSEGFVKNRYVGRTFIMPGQQARRSSVKMKLNTMPDEFAGKNVLLVDDSIVRGTTSKQIVQMARDAGAKRVFFASAAPPICYPNVYGIDMPDREELIAHQRTADEVAKLINADRLIYNTLDDVIEAVSKAVRGSYQAPRRFEDSVFTGEYVTGKVTPEYLDMIAQQRNDMAKAAKNKLVSQLLSEID